MSFNALEALLVSSTERGVKHLGGAFITAAFLGGHWWSRLLPLTASMPQFKHFAPFRFRQLDIGGLPRLPKHRLIEDDLGILFT